MPRSDTRNKIPVDPSSSTALVPAGEPERLLADQLMERAREEGIELVGPEGLLTKVTKSVLESALEGELTEHLGYEPYELVAEGVGTLATGGRESSSTQTSDRSISRSPGTATAPSSRPSCQSTPGVSTASTRRPSLSTRRGSRPARSKPTWPRSTEPRSPKTP